MHTRVLFLKCVSASAGEAHRVAGRGQRSPDERPDAAEGALQHSEPQRHLAHQPHQTADHGKRRVSEQQQLLDGTRRGHGGRTAAHASSGEKKKEQRLRGSEWVFWKKTFGEISYFFIRRCGAVSPRAGGHLTAVVIRAEMGGGGGGAKPVYTPTHTRIYKTQTQTVKRFKEWMYAVTWTKHTP